MLTTAVKCSCKNEFCLFGEKKKLGSKNIDRLKMGLTNYIAMLTELKAALYIHGALPTINNIRHLITNKKIR